MAYSTTGAATANSARQEIENLPTLFSRLGEDVMQLLDSKLSLLKVEIREETQAYIRGGILMIVGGVIAATGFAFLNMAIAFGVSTLFANSTLSQSARYAIGFVIVGVVYLILGGIVVAVVKNRLANYDLVPNRTVEELRKDKQWLKKEL